MRAGISVEFWHSSHSIYIIPFYDGFVKGYACLVRFILGGILLESEINTELALFRLTPIVRPGVCVEQVR